MFIDAMLKVIGKTVVFMPRKKDKKVKLITKVPFIIHKQEKLKLHSTPFGGNRQRTKVKTKENPLKVKLKFQSFSNST